MEEIFRIDLGQDSRNGATLMLFASLAHNQQMRWNAVIEVFVFEGTCFSLVFAEPVGTQYQFVKPDSAPILI